MSALEKTGQSLISSSTLIPLGVVGGILAPMFALAFYLSASFKDLSYGIQLNRSAVEGIRQDIETIRLGLVTRTELRLYLELFQAKNPEMTIPPLPADPPTTGARRSAQ